MGERSAGIVHLTSPFIVYAFTLTYTSKIKAHDRTAEFFKRFRKCGDYFVVHRATKKWVRVTYQREGTRRGRALNGYFQRTGWPGDGGSFVPHLLNAKPLYNAPANQMLGHNFINIMFIHHRVPNFLRIHHTNRAVFATV